MQVACPWLVGNCLLLWKLKINDFDDDIIDSIKSYILNINTTDETIIENACVKHEGLMQKNKIKYFNFDFLKDKQKSDILIEKTKEEEFKSALQRKIELGDGRMIIRIKR